MRHKDRKSRVLLAAVLSFPRQTAGLIFRGEVGLGQRAVFPHWVEPGPAQPMMNLTLMTLQWGTMSSGKHSGSPSCSGDQSSPAAQRGGWGTLQGIQQGPGSQPRDPPNALARWSSQTQQLPAASWLRMQRHGNVIWKSPWERAWKTSIFLSSPL